MLGMKEREWVSKNHGSESKLVFDFPWNAVIETPEITAILCDLFFSKSPEDFF